jgi:hypothetical protein
MDYSSRILRNLSIKSYYVVSREQSHKHNLVNIRDDAIGNEFLIPIPIFPIPVQDYVDQNVFQRKSRIKRTSVRIFHHHVAAYG